MDTLKITFKFDINNEAGLPPPRLARLLLDAQYLVMACLALSGELPPDDKLFTDDSRQKYKRLIEATGEETGEAALTVSHIMMGSLLVDLQAKVREKAKPLFAAAFDFIMHQLFFEIERERRKVSVDIQKEEQLKKRIENADAVRKMRQEMPEHRDLLDSVFRTLLTFDAEPLRLASSDLYEKDKETGGWRTLPPPPPPVPDQQETTAQAPDEITRSTTPVQQSDSVKPKVRPPDFEKLLFRLFRLFLIVAVAVMLFMFVGFLLSLFR